MNISALCVMFPVIGRFETSNITFCLSEIDYY